MRDDIRARREACGMTQQDLAAKIGVTRGAISHLEKGRPMSMALAIRVDDALRFAEGKSQRDALPVAPILAAAAPVAEAPKPKPRKRAPRPAPIRRSIEQAIREEIDAGLRRYHDHMRDKLSATIFAER